MVIQQSSTFKKLVKKLHKNEKQELDFAIRQIIANPLLGDSKVGDLNHVRVFKFTMIKQLTLLAYTVSFDKTELLLLSFGSHENFYRDLKKNR